MGPVVAMGIWTAGVAVALPLLRRFYRGRLAALVPEALVLRSTNVVERDSEDRAVAWDTPLMEVFDGGSERAIRAAGGLGFVGLGVVGAGVFADNIGVHDEAVLYMGLSWLLAVFGLYLLAATASDGLVLARRRVRLRDDGLTVETRYGLLGRGEERVVVSAPDIAGWRIINVPVRIGRNLVTHKQLVLDRRDGKPLVLAGALSEWLLDPHTEGLKARYGG